MFEGISLPEFMNWKNSESKELRDKFKNLRQRAKAINFGIPSGESSQGLQAYAKSAYSVELTLEEAADFRARLITQVYPELNCYLKESEMLTLATNLGVEEEHCWNKFAWSKSKRSPAIPGGVRNVVRGRTVRRKDGKEYNKAFVNKVWRGLKQLCCDPQIFTLLKECNDRGNEELYKLLFGDDVCTLTGRIRGRVGFTQSRNTPFSGLAADGAKLAMWNLMQVGYRIVGFIHDEILIELKESDNLAHEVKVIEEVICSSMQELTGTIPITCGAALSRVWSKGATDLYNKEGNIIIWEQANDGTADTLIPSTITVK